MSAPQVVMLLGNPGSGKSTLLNGLVGEAKFQSGVSYGKGVTSTTSSVQVGNTLYVDTPGLADIKMRDQASAEITKALNQTREYRLITYSVWTSCGLDLVGFDAETDAMKKSVQRLEDDNKWMEQKMQELTEELETNSQQSQQSMFSEMIKEFLHKLHKILVEFGGFVD
ncbi:hypothetical protein HDU98_004832 [Podochytrium sp. JEL0797]|nr:hypothetical protein HDU98_004832 [Podochytrium sp. JEL0797]